MFYQPLTINFDNWDNAGTDVDSILIPDGDGYEEIGVTTGTTSNFTLTDGSTDKLLNLAAADNENITIGNALTFQFSYSAANTSTVYLVDPDSGTNILTPAIVILEGKDESDAYNAVIIKTGGGGTSDNGVGVSDIDFTWNRDYNMENSANGASGAQLESDEDLYTMMDQYGTIATTDRSVSDQYTASISYPEEQVIANVYVAEGSASISTGTTTPGSSIGKVLVTDNEISSVSSKHLIIVGGSCINAAAAKALGVATGTCGTAFTTATGIGPNEFLIQSVEGAYSEGKIALVVAGYEAAETGMATTYLTTSKPDVAAGKKWKGTSSTTATLMTEATA
jgi:hypothetical protein